MACAMTGVQSEPDLWYAQANNTPMPQNGSTTLISKWTNANSSPLMAMPAARPQRAPIARKSSDRKNNSSPRGAARTTESPRTAHTVDVIASVSGSGLPSARRERSRPVTCSTARTRSP